MKSNSKISEKPKRSNTSTTDEQRKRQMRILELQGKIDYDPNYDYKKARMRKR